MGRYALKIEYHGEGFAGWQRQPDQPSVQGMIEAALAKLEPRAHTIGAAGRTDAGVHGLAQVAHCDLFKDWDPFRLSEALNYHLKKTRIAIVDCRAVSESFHARFSALERQYLFRLISRRAPLTHERGLAWQIKHKLDVHAMQAGANLLLGMHDFTTFRSSICQAKSPMKSIEELRIETLDATRAKEYQFHVRARSFLHNQVRSIVGTLERVGSGSWSVENVAEALAAKDRTACGPVCPPHGLYLANVTYAEDPFAD